MFKPRTGPRFVFVTALPLILHPFVTLRVHALELFGDSVIGEGFEGLDHGGMIPLAAALGLAGTE